MRLAIVSAVLLLLPRLAPAFASDTNEADPIPIVLDETSKAADGHIVTLSAAARDTGPVFVINELTTLQPIRVSVLADEPQDKLQVKITKAGGKTTIAEGATGLEAKFVAKFRTYGDIWVRVVSPGAPKTFQMVIWVGDTMQPQVKSILHPIP